MKNKKIFLGIFSVLVITGGILLLIKNNSLSNSLSPQGIIPTSTSAPTPTSVYGKKTERQVPPNPINTITLTADGFSPKILVIKRGTTVTWVNKSGSEATVNSDPHPTHTNYPPLNLGQFNDGDSLQLQFNKPGRYGYHNHFDATQTGTIIVK